MLLHKKRKVKADIQDQNQVFFTFIYFAHLSWNLIVSKVGKFLEGILILSHLYKHVSCIDCELLFFCKWDRNKIPFENQQPILKENAIRFGKGPC